MSRKLRIGEKLTAGEDNGPKQKRFTNGHKTFTSMEALAIRQTQIRENKTAEKFNANIMALTRDPNPLQGELRRAPAFPTEFYEKEPPPPEVITADTKVLPDNPLRRSDKNVESVQCLQTLQDNVNGELNYMKDLIKSKESELKSKRTIIRF